MGSLTVGNNPVGLGGLQFSMFFSFGVFIMDAWRSVYIGGNNYAIELRSLAAQNIVG